MSLIFVFDEELNGEIKSGGNGNYPKLGHAYTCEITTVEEHKGWINIGVKGVGYTAGQYDKFSFWKAGKFTLEQIKKLANNVIASNPSMQGAIGKKDLDISKWANKGLKVGVVYKADQTKDEATGEYVESKFVTPGFSIAIDSVEGWDPDVEAYEAHRKRHWSEGGDQASAPVTEAPVVVEDESDSLPF
jgi:hypothetical protein